MDSRRILQRRFGFDGAEGDDLRDPVVAPLVGCVAHHLTAAPVVEVDIDVGHRGALGVEEPLEQQTVWNRVDVGDAQRVGDQRAGGRAAAGTHPYARRPRVADQVGDDQKVRWETFGADDVDLVGGALAVPVRRTGRKSPAKPGVHLVTQPGRLVMPIGHRKHGHPVARCPHVGVGLHPFGDQQGGVTRARHFVVPDLAHLGGRLQVVAVTVELEAIRIREGLAGLHTQQSLMVVGGVAGHVVAVIGGKRRNVERASDLEQTVTDPAFDGQPVVHQLKEVVVRSDDLPPLRRGFERLPILAEPQAGLHLPRRASGGDDDALGVFGDELGVHARPLAQLALEGSMRGQLEQVAQTGGVLGHHRQVRVGAAAGDVVGLLAGVTPQDAPGVEPRARRDVCLHADDRLDPGLGRGVVELAGTEHVSVVGHPHRGHPQPLHLGEHGRDLRGTVQHRILGVVVQVHEGGPRR
ncbi:Uncharacterised protein [Mycobacterium tuberculosis]|uniref:Uncharacterized protein n=1 Tax=Mycobacterium tuberculosis TaxID=1773 RepID=A0A654TGD2_MYCTX|nr:Uncharacterised protein [Mycobacterium tuberculosis]CKR29256.1 Uncharacterised protein [Mycobacterium tuberculosis]CKR70354.1 Uncharacterised protein [Mycobacterium tuberculosis]CKR92688.1 Uncharacterised protein [Mycobacterium tuberculosis]COV91501.1 Uncharacterised protein [Mycobacterium tuberculosis]